MRREALQEGAHDSGLCSVSTAAVHNRDLGHYDD